MKYLIIFTLLLCSCTPSVHKKHQKNVLSNLRDYQLEVNDSTIRIYDFHRLVSILPFDTNSSLGGIILNDNL